MALSSIYNRGRQAPALSNGRRVDGPVRPAHPCGQPSSGHPTRSSRRSMDRDRFPSPSADTRTGADVLRMQRASGFRRAPACAGDPTGDATSGASLAGWPRNLADAEKDIADDEHLPPIADERPTKAFARSNRLGHWATPPPLPAHLFFRGPGVLFFFFFFSLSLFFFLTEY